MKRSTARLLAEAEALSKMVTDPNVSTEQLYALFGAFLDSNTTTIRKARVPKKKVRRGIGSY